MMRKECWSLTSELPVATSADEFLPTEHRNVNIGIKVKIKILVTEIGIMRMEIRLWDSIQEFYLLTSVKSAMVS